MILVTGANGALGRLVTAQLTKLGVAFTAGTRDPKAVTGAPTRHVDFDDPASLTTAFEGVDVLLAISAGAAEDDVVLNRYRNLVAAAKAAGVRQVVYTSLAAEGDHMTIALPHRYAERLLAESGLAVTILRNGIYAEMLAPMAAMAVADGAFTAPFADGRLAVIARADLAEIAATVAAESVTDGNEHVGRTYELVGDRAVGAAEVVAAIGERVGRAVPYQPIGLAAMREGLTAAGLPPVQLTHTLSMVANVAAGLVGGTRTDAPRLLGRPLRPVLDVVVDGLA